MMFYDAIINETPIQETLIKTKVKNLITVEKDVMIAEAIEIQISIRPGHIDGQGVLR